MPEVRACRGCKCTEDNACVDELGNPCSWAPGEGNLCSTCAALPTKERLARDLEREGLPEPMVQRARDGWYDDWDSPNAMPLNLLHQDFKDHGRQDLADDVAAGRWDGSKAESDAWAKSEEGQEAFADLAGGLAGSKRGKEETDEEWLNKVAAENAVRRTNPLKNEQGEQLPLKHPEVMLAAADMVKRCGATQFEVGYDQENGKMTWWASATMHTNEQLGEASGKTARSPNLATPEAAAEALAAFLVNGGECQNCHRTTQLGGDRKNRNKVCRYIRIGAEWKRGCA